MCMCNVYVSCVSVRAREVRLSRVTEELNGKKKKLVERERERNLVARSVLHLLEDELFDGGRWGESAPVPARLVSRYSRWIGVLIQIRKELARNQSRCRFLANQHEKSERSNERRRDTAERPSAEDWIFGCYEPEFSRFLQAKKIPFSFSNAFDHGCRVTLIRSALFSVKARNR